MEKRGGIVLGIGKKSTKIRKSNKGIAKAVADYLLSDCYMYAPLVDSLPHSLPLLPSPLPSPYLGLDPSTPPTKTTNTPPAPGKGMPVVQLQRVLAK